MKAIIIAYSKEANGGILRDDSGQTYYFSRNDWQSEHPPANDMAVIFEPGYGVAKRVLRRP